MDAPTTPDSRDAVEGSIAVRSLEPRDGDALERFYAALTPESRWLRFFSASRGLSHEQSTWFCRATRDHHRGLIALAQDADGSESIVGHLCLEPDQELVTATAGGTWDPALADCARVDCARVDCARVESAEVAVVVADAFRGRGIGHALVREGMVWARTQGVRRLTASTLVANEPIRRLLTDFGLTARPVPPAAGVCSLAIDLTRGTPAMA